MLVEQIWTANNFRNFNYLIACPETGEALAIDPLDSEKCLTSAKKKGWEITQILNTHHHHDHIGGNQDVVDATGARVIAHAQASDQIPGMDIGLKAGDIVKVKDEAFKDDFDRARGRFKEDHVYANYHVTAEDTQRWREEKHKATEEALAAGEDTFSINFDKI